MQAEERDGGGRSQIRGLTAEIEEAPRHCDKSDCSAKSSRKNRLIFDIYDNMNQKENISLLMMLHFEFPWMQF